MSTKTLPLVWTKHIKDPAKRSSFEQALKASSTFSQRLLEILEEEEKELDKASLTIKDFDDPSWAFKQAFRLGEKSRIKRIKDLLDFANPSSPL